MALAYQARYNARVVASGAAFDTATLDYLDTHFAQHVTAALDACLRTQPRRPVEFIAEQLLQHARNDKDNDNNSNNKETKKNSSSSRKKQQQQQSRSQASNSSSSSSTVAADDVLTLQVGDGLTCTLTPARSLMTPAEQLPGLPVVHLCAPAAYEVAAALRFLEAVAVPNAVSGTPTPTLILVEPPLAPTQVMFVRGAAYLVDLVAQLQLLRRRQARQHTTTRCTRGGGGGDGNDDDHNMTDDTDRVTAATAAAQEQQQQQQQQQQLRQLQLLLPGPGETYDDKALTLLRRALDRNGDDRSAASLQTLHEAMHAVVYAEGDTDGDGAAAARARQLVVLPATSCDYFDTFEHIDKGMRAVMHPTAGTTHTAEQPQQPLPEHTTMRGDGTRQAPSSPYVQPPSVLFVSYRSAAAASLTLTRVLAAFVPYYERCQRLLLAEARQRQQQRARALAADVLRSYWADVHRRRATRDEQRAHHHQQQQRRRAAAAAAAATTASSSSVTTTATSSPQASQQQLTATMTATSRRGVAAAAGAVAADAQTHTMTTPAASTRTPSRASTPHTHDSARQQPLLLQGGAANNTTTTTRHAPPVVQPSPATLTATSAAVATTRPSSHTVAASTHPPSSSSAKSQRAPLPPSPSSSAAAAAAVATAAPPAASASSSASQPATTTVAATTPAHATHAADVARQRRRQDEDAAFVAVLHALRTQAAVCIQAAYRRHRVRRVMQSAPQQRQQQQQQQVGNSGSSNSTDDVRGKRAPWPRLALPLSPDTPPLLRVCLACLRHAHRIGSSSSNNSNSNGSEVSGSNAAVSSRYAFFDNYAASAPADCRRLTRYAPHRRVLPSSSTSPSHSLAATATTTMTTAALSASAAAVMDSSHVNSLAATGNSISYVSDDDVVSEAETWARETLVLPPTRATLPPPRVNVLQRLLVYARLARCDVLHEAMKLQREYGGLSLLQRRAYDGLRGVVLCLLHIAYTELWLRGALPRHTHYHHSNNNSKKDNSNSNDEDSNDSTVRYTFREYVRHCHAELLAALSQPHTTSLRCRSAHGAAVGAHAYTRDCVLVRLAGDEDDERDDDDDSAEDNADDYDGGAAASLSSASLPLLRELAPRVYCVLRAPLRVREATRLLRVLARTSSRGVYAADATASGAAHDAAYTPATVVTAPATRRMAAAYSTQQQPPSATAARGAVAVTWLDLCPHPYMYVDGVPWLLLPRRNAQHVEGRGDYDAYATRHGEDGDNGDAEVHTQHDDDGDDDDGDVRAVRNDVAADEAALLRCVHDELVARDGTLTCYTVAHDDDNTDADDGDGDAAVPRHAPTHTRRCTCACPYAAHETAARLLPQCHVMLLDTDNNNNNRASHHHLRSNNNTMAATAAVSAWSTRVLTPAAAMMRAAAAATAPQATVTLSHCRLRPHASAYAALSADYDVFLGRCVAQLQRGACLVLSCELCTQLLYIAGAALVARAVVQEPRDGRLRSTPTSLPHERSKANNNSTSVTAADAVVRGVVPLPPMLHFLDDYHAHLRDTLSRYTVDVDDCVAAVHALLRELATTCVPTTTNTTTTAAAAARHHNDEDNNDERVDLLARMAYHITAAEAATSEPACRRHTTALTRLTETYCCLVLLRIFLALPATQKTLAAVLSTATPSARRPPPPTTMQQTTTATTTTAAAAAQHDHDAMLLPSFSAFVREHDLLRWAMYVDPWRACAHRCPDTTHVRYSNWLRRWDSDAYVCFGVL